jgi:hypothetical protein
VVVIPVLHVIQVQNTVTVRLRNTSLYADLIMTMAVDDLWPCFWWSLPMCYAYVDSVFTYISLYTHEGFWPCCSLYTRTDVDHVFPYDDIGILTEPVQLIFRNDTDAVLCGIRFPKKLPHGDPLRCLGTAFTTTFNFAFVAGAMLFWNQLFNIGLICNIGDGGNLAPLHQKYSIIYYS